MGRSGTVLLLGRFDRDKPHARPAHRLADRRGIRRVGLVALDVRLDVLRRHQPHLVANRLHCRKLSFPAKGSSGGRTLLAQNAVQPELGRAHHVGHVPPDQTAATDLATKAVPSLSGVTSSRSAVNHLLKSVVREIRTLRSVGTGGGRPPPVIRWCPVMGIPTAIAPDSTERRRIDLAHAPAPCSALYALPPGCCFGIAGCCRPCCRKRQSWPCRC
jgi:hypothetical protein